MIMDFLNTDPRIIVLIFLVLFLLFLIYNRAFYVVRIILVISFFLVAVFGVYYCYGG
jgi:hypothetical protein